MRITVMGTGAVGGYYGAKLAAAGHDVTFVARAANYATLHERGISVQSVAGDFSLHHVTVEEVPESAVTAHVVLFAVKSGATDAAAQALAPYISANPTQDGAILSLQNGVDNEAQIAAITSPERVVGGVAYIEADMPEPGRIVHVSAGNLVISATTEAAKPFRHATAFAAACKEAGVECAIAPDSRTIKWNKLAFNAVFNPLTALTGTTAGDLLADPEAVMLMRTVLAEVVAVANAEGVALPAALPDTAMQTAVRMQAATSSMRRDFDRNNPLEIEALVGTLVRRGRQNHIATPALQTLYALLRVIERQRGHAVADVRV